MLKFELILLLAFFLSIAGCTETPDETDIDEIVEEIENEIEEEQEDLCGDNYVQEWEECDFTNFKSCSSYDENFTGPASCETCKWNIKGCVDIDSCPDKFCSGNGTCLEAYLFYDIYCECDEGYEGADCSIKTGE